MAEIVGGVGTSHIPAVGAAVDKGKTGDAVLEAVLRQAAAGARVDRRGRSRRVHRRLQRPRQRVLAGADPDVRARPGRPLRDRRRGVRTASGPGGRGASRVGLAPRRVVDPRRVRHDARQRDDGRPRPHGAVVGDVRRARCVALQGDPARRQRRAVPAANRPSLLPARPGDPPGGRVVRGQRAGRDLRHRRSVAPAPGRARRT